MKREKKISLAIETNREQRSCQKWEERGGGEDEDSVIYKKSYKKRNLGRNILISGLAASCSQKRRFIYHAKVEYIYIQRAPLWRRNEGTKPACGHAGQHR